MSLYEYIDVLRLLLPGVIIIFQLETHFIFPLIGIVFPLWMSNISAVVFLLAFFTIVLTRLVALIIFAAHWVLYRNIPGMLWLLFVRERFDLVGFQHYMLYFLRLGSRSSPPGLTEVVAWLAVIALDLIHRAGPLENPFLTFFTNLVLYIMGLLLFVTCLFATLCLLIILRHFIFIRF